MEYATLGKIPIDEQNAVGEDIRYDDDFEKIEAEIAKLTSPSASNQVDWELVKTLSETILETKSKHLLVSVYLVYALYHLRGIEGLNDGMTVLDGLLETYWDVFYPPLRRVRGRINAIEWLLDKLTKAFESVETIAVESDTKDTLMALLKKIDDFLNEVLDEPPLFYNLIKLVDMKLVIPEAAQEEAPQKKEPEAYATENASGPTVAASQQDEKDFSGLVGSLNLLIGEMIQAKDYRSELFVINRAFAWMDIQEPPFAEKNVTMLPPPDTQEREILQKLYEEKDFDALLWAAESRVPTYLFWLDLHFYVAKSLESLGQKYAAEAVLEATLSYLKKLPKLQNLTFSDTTPFASKITKKWLHSKEEGKADTVVSEKREVVPCSAQGIDRLSELINHAASVEEAVLYNIDLCTCLAKGSNAILIHAYTKQLLSNIEEYGIDRWKPKVALDAYLVAIECLENLDHTDDLTAQLYDKIALLKPSLIDV